MRVLLSVRESIEFIEKLSPYGILLSPALSFVFIVVLLLTETSYNLATLYLSLLTSADSSQEIIFLV